MKSNFLQNIKTLLLTATITLFSISALLGIIFILVGTDTLGWRVVGTVAILGLLSLLSMNNVMRLESPKAPIRNLSTTALISNLFWAIPWILIVWNAFKSFLCTQVPQQYLSAQYYLVADCPAWYNGMIELIIKIALTAGIISITTTIASNFLGIKNYTQAIGTLKNITTYSAATIGLYFLPAIWTEGANYIHESWRFITIIFIIFVFSSIVTPILARIARSKTDRPKAYPSPIDEKRLRQEIEAKVRAEIAAEQRAKSEEDTSR